MPARPALETLPLQSQNRETLPLTKVLRMQSLSWPRLSEPYAGEVAPTSNVTASAALRVQETGSTTQIHVVSGLIVGRS